MEADLRHYNCMFRRWNAGSQVLIDRYYPITWIKSNWKIESRARMDTIRPAAFPPSGGRQQSDDDSTRGECTPLGQSCAVLGAAASAHGLASPVRVRAGRGGNLRGPALARHLLPSANWVYVGQTTGRGRQDRQYAQGGTVREVFVYPLVRHWREALVAPESVKEPGAEEIPSTRSARRGATVQGNFTELLTQGKLTERRGRKTTGASRSPHASQLPTGGYMAISALRESSFLFSDEHHFETIGGMKR